MNPVRIKVCGITRPEDAALADELAVDAIGFVFVKKSKRFIQLNDAARISLELGPFMQRVGLFLDDERELVDQAIAEIPNLLPQFHGREPADYCDQFNRPYIKAIGVAGGIPADDELRAYKHCAGFLFDSNAPGALGGTGHTFDWQQLRDWQTDSRRAGNIGRRIVLAGGLNLDNIGDAIKQVKPHAIDVSSGVEAGPGIKDAELMRKFVAAARAVPAT